MLPNYLFFLQTSSCNTVANATQAASGSKAMLALRSTLAAVAAAPIDVTSIAADTPVASSRRLRPNSTHEKLPTPMTLAAQRGECRAACG